MKRHDMTAGIQFKEALEGATGPRTSVSSKVPPGGLAGIRRSIASGQSRSLLLGRITQLHDEDAPISNARIDAGSIRCHSDSRGAYCLPLDALELPVRLRVTAPGYFTRTESIDWSPIMSGGMLMRDFQLVEDRHRLELSAPTDPASEETVEAMEGELEAPVEVVSLPAGDEDEDRPDFSGLTGLALETSILMQGRPGEARAGAGRILPDPEKGGGSDAAGSENCADVQDPSPRASTPPLHDLDVLAIGFEAGSFIPTETLTPGPVAFTAELDADLAALVDTLAEQDVSVLGEWGLQSGQMPSSDPDAGGFGGPGARAADGEPSMEGDEALMEGDEALVEGDEALVEGEEPFAGEEELAFEVEDSGLEDLESLLDDDDAFAWANEGAFEGEEGAFEGEEGAFEGEEGAFEGEEGAFEGEEGTFGGGGRGHDGAGRGLGGGGRGLDREEHAFEEDKTMLEDDVETGEAEPEDGDPVLEDEGGGSAHGRFEPAHAEKKVEAHDPEAVALEASDQAEPGSRLDMPAGFPPGQDSWYYDSGEGEEYEVLSPARRGYGRGGFDRPGSGRGDKVASGGHGPGRTRDTGNRPGIRRARGPSFQREADRDAQSILGHGPRRGP